MRPALVLVLVLGPLTVLASIIFGSGLEVELTDNELIDRGIHDDPAAPTPDSFVDGTTLYERWPQLGSTRVNRTKGSIGRGEGQPNNSLEARQFDVSTGFNPCERR